MNCRINIIMTAVFFLIINLIIISCGSDDDDTLINPYGYDIGHDNETEATCCSVSGGMGDFTNYWGMTFNIIVEKDSHVTFTMGSPENEVDRGYNETQHWVRLAKPFYMQTTEVTRCQWEKVVMEAEAQGKLTPGKLYKNPKSWIDCPACPVEHVSWNDIQTWIAALNQIEDETYALPSEAQWEYSCRALNYNFPFAFGACLSTDHANYNGVHYPYDQCPEEVYRVSPIEVASLHKNNWGLYDMHGNVWEWVQDGSDDYPTTLKTDYVGEGFYRVRRGGAWNEAAKDCRSANRDSLDPDFRLYGLGFRLVLLPGQQ